MSGTLILVSRATRLRASLTRTACSFPPRRSPRPDLSPVPAIVHCRKGPERRCGMSYNLFYWPLLANTPEDSVVSRTGFVQKFDRVCIELKARGANDFVELCK